MLGFSNAKQGETDEGEPVKFRLNRLTSILNLSVQGGAGAGDAVRHILLTSENDGQPLSAQSIDFDISTLGADVALNAGARSNVIALGFDPGTAPAADAFEAYFNILPGNYDRLTFDVITEAKQIGTVTVTRDDPGRKFAAGMLYRKEAADLTFRPAEAPSLNWPGPRTERRARDHGGRERNPDLLCGDHDRRPRQASQGFVSRSLRNFSTT